MGNINNIPKIRFPEFKDSWNEILLSTALKPTNIKNSEGLYTKEDMLSVSSSAGVVNQMDYKGRSLAGKSVLPYNVLKKDEIVYTKSPLSDYPYGIIKYNTFSDGIVSTLYATYIVKKGYSGLFIDYYFQLSDRLNKYLKPLVNIGAKNDMKVNNEKVLIDTVIFPEFKEQERIATFLSDIDKKIQALYKKKELLEEYKKGISQKLFSKRIRLKKNDGTDFSEWKEENGDVIFKSVSNKEHNSDLPILAITQEYGAIPRELIDFNIQVSDKSVEGYKVVEKADFIISLRSFQGGIEYSNYKGICSPAYIVLRARFKIDDRFYKYYFKTDYYIQQLNKKLEGIRDGKMISYKYFSEIKLPLPSIQEQTKIADFITEIAEKMKYIDIQLESLEKWKKGLLQKMFC